ncbi:hypothetical protein [Amycolatopsis silviterrae]|uniref:Uncharacterized protein n=1 Tax=Amycolatopsis silviterrae TaxID=1656914 RepID=A0ABW5H3H1_9PSEU
MGQDGAEPVPSLAPLPEPVHRAAEVFRECLIEVARLADAVPPDGSADGVLRRGIRQALDGRSQLPEELFDALLRAAVHDPDPSFNRQFVEPAVTAFGRRRVQEALLGCLATGTDPERAGAARAWYWAEPRLVCRGEALVATPESQAEYDAHADLGARWNAAALREFVANEDLDVRCCVLPVLPLHPSAHPGSARGLIAEAVRVARTHPDGYLRSRVEIQVRSGAE